MSDFHVEAVVLKDVAKHPNADSLSIGDANGHPVIFRTGDYVEGELVVHIPVDSVVPDVPEWSFLAGHRRIRAKRLRGVFSMGMLAKAPSGTELGADLREAMGIEKYEPVLAAGLRAGIVSGNFEVDPGFLPEYTDLESFRRHQTVLQDGEPVVLTEKVHGCNARFVYRDDRLWVGSHHRILARPGAPGIKHRGKWSHDGLVHTTRPFDTEEEAIHELDVALALDNGRSSLGISAELETPKVPTWWAVALDLDLETKLARHPGIAIYGEVYGNVQDLKYGLPDGAALTLFDALDVDAHRYLDRAEFLALAADLGLPTAPVLFEGGWSRELLTLAEGRSTLPRADCVREGFVVKPLVERHERSIGRVVLKVVGEGYLTRKGG